MLGAQIGLSLCFGLAVWAIVGQAESISVGLGFLVSFVPNLFMAWCVGVERPYKTAKQVLRAFYLGEAVKLILAAALFYLALMLPDVKVLYLMLGFVGGIVVFWFALLVRNTSKVKR
jgi:ATP synthase protein I